MVSSEWGLLSMKAAEGSVMATEKDIIAKPQFVIDLQSGVDLLLYSFIIHKRLHWGEIQIKWGSAEIKSSTLIQINAV